MRLGELRIVLDELGEKCGGIFPAPGIGEHDRLEEAHLRVSRATREVAVGTLQRGRRLPGAMQPVDLGELFGERREGGQPRPRAGASRARTLNLDCIVAECTAAERNCALQTRGHGRYTDSIVGYALDAEALLAAAPEAGARCEAGPRRMTLRIHNTLTRATETFQPIEPSHVRMYVCGMTVYDLCHVGHARVMMAFDVVQRWLKTLGYRVTYVRNVTDIDDKIIKRALERNITIRALTEEMIEAMHQDVAALGIEPPTHEPRATDYVPQMLDMIGALEEKGLGYRSRNGDVNYAVRKFPGYGKLSGKSIDELRAGERVAVLDGKEDPARLRAVEGGQGNRARRRQVGQPLRPRPARLAHRVLGDVQGDPRRALRHPRRRPGPAVPAPRERDRAERGRATAARSSTCWMHNGFLNVDNEKMSKSLGNFFTIRDVLKRYDGETLRFFMLRAHYRSPFNFSDAHLDDARSALRRLYTALDGACRRQPRPSRLDRPARRPRSRRRWTTTSTRRSPWPCCSSWPARSTAARSPERRGAAEARWARRWASCSRRRAPSCRRAAASTRPASPRASRHAPPPSSARDFAAPTDPRRAAGAGHRAEGLAAGHHLGEGLSCARSPPMRAWPRPSTGTMPAGTCRKRDRVMRKLIPQFGDGRLKPRRRLHDAGAIDRRPADLGQGGAVGLGPLRRR